MFPWHVRLDYLQQGSDMPQSVAPLQVQQQVAPIRIASRGQIVQGSSATEAVLMKMTAVL